MKIENEENVSSFHHRKYNEKIFRTIDECIKKKRFMNVKKDEGYYGF